MDFMIDSVHVASAAKKKEIASWFWRRNFYFASLAYGCSIGL
jgi:hypothetical protein